MNIVFDLGGVLLKWNPKEVGAKYFPQKSEQKVVRKDILGHPDWLELDRGTLPLEKAISCAVARTGLEKKAVARFLENFPSELIPDPDVLNIIRKLYDSRQHKLYVLSNMHLQSVKYIKQKYDFWYLFDGIIFSSQVKMIKPDPEIYNYLLEEYELKAESSIFIDDSKENILAATKLNFKTIHFVDVLNCETELERLSITY